MLLSVCSSLFDALRPVFTRSASYCLVCGILVGMMLAQGDTTLTNVYLSLTAARARCRQAVLVTRTSPSSSLVAGRKPYRGVLGLFVGNLSQRAHHC